MKRKHKKFIGWFINRLRNKHHEDPEVVDEIVGFLQNHIFLKRQTTVQSLDKICKEFYPDFDIDRNPDIAFGYTEEERNHMRKMIVKAINELSIL
jgi:hypothetical protein